MPLLSPPRDASSGDWDTESCQTLETQAAHTRCQCQRLSTFAVLAQPPKDLVRWRGVSGYRLIPSSLSGGTCGFQSVPLGWSLGMICFRQQVCGRVCMHKHCFLW